MTKKEQVITLLDSLLPIWDFAPELKHIVETYPLPESMLDKIITGIDQSVHEMQSDFSKEALQHTLQILANIHDEELKTQKSDQADLTALEEYFTL